MLTFRNASNSSSWEYFLYRPVGMRMPSSIAFRIALVASMTFSALMIAPPTMMIRAPASTACATVSLFSPPATATGSPDALHTALSSSRGVWAIICSSMLTCRLR